MSVLAIFASLLTVAVLGLTVLANWMWPKASKRRLAVLCGFACPALLLGAYPVGLLWIWKKPSAGFDADGMTLVVIGFWLTAGAVISAGIALPVAYLMISRLRRQQ